MSILNVHANLSGGSGNVRQIGAAFASDCTIVGERGRLLPAGARVHLGLLLMKVLRVMTEVVLMMMIVMIGR